MTVKTTTSLILLCFSLQVSLCQSAESPYQLELKKELAIFGGGVVLGTSGFILENNITPLTDQEIANLDHSAIWAIDEAALTNYSANAAQASDYLKVIGWFLPFTFAIPETTRHDFWTIAVMGAETTFLTYGLTSVLKGSVRRTRPYVYNDIAPPRVKMNRDARKSFFSGHTSNFSTLSFFTAKVISDYSDNDTVDIAAWSIAALSSGTMGYFRIKAGMHFFTDVMAGYLVGAAMGIAIPHLHRADRSKKVSIVPYYDFYSSGFNVVVAL